MNPESFSDGFLNGNEREDEYDRHNLAQRLGVVVDTLLLEHVEDVQRSMVQPCIDYLDTSVYSEEVESNLRVQVLRKQIYGEGKAVTTYQAVAVAALVNGCTRMHVGFVNRGDGVVKCKTFPGRGSLRDAKPEEVEKTHSLLLGSDSERSD